MSDTQAGTSSSRQKKPGFKPLPLLALLAAIALFGVAFVYAGGPAYVASLLGGGTDAPTGTKPSTPITPSTPATTSVEPTASAEPTAAVTAAGYGLDPAAKARMFYEQVASRATITELAEGKFASFAFGTPSGSGADRSIPVTATYKAGGSFSGTLLLKQYQNAWYFAAIARGGNSLAVKPSGLSVDMGVVNTIVEEQRANQGLISEIVSGGYTGLSLGAPSGGAGTKTIPITMAASAPRAGRIVLIRKVAGGRTYWFITSFSD